MYYIYHIKGIKIGCSKQPNRRVKQQGYTEFQILEQHDDIEIASKREIELQEEYGYKKDCTKYSQTISSPTIEGIKKGGQKLLKIHNEWKNKYPDEYKKSLKKWWSEGGKARGPIQGNINKENGHMSRLGKQMTEHNNRIQTCSYCNETSKGIGYSRWHGKNCFFAKENVNDLITQIKKEYIPKHPLYGKCNIKKKYQLSEKQFNIIFRST